MCNDNANRSKNSHLSDTPRGTSSPLRREDDDLSQHCVGGSSLDITILATSRTSIIYHVYL